MTCYSSFRLFIVQSGVVEFLSLISIQAVKNSELATVQFETWRSNFIKSVVSVYHLIVSPQRIILKIVEI